MLQYALLGMGMLLAAAPDMARAESYSSTTTTSYFQPAAYRQASGGGEYCREFQRDVMVGGRMQPGYGTACMQPDGAWKFPDGSYADAQGTGDMPWAGAPMVQTVRHDRYYDPYYDPYGPRFGGSSFSLHIGDYGPRYPRHYYGHPGRGHGHYKHWKRRHHHHHHDHHGGHRRRGWDGGRW